MKQLPDELIRNEAAWRAWYTENEPETVSVPHFETRFSTDTGSAPFLVAWMEAFRQAFGSDFKFGHRRKTNHPETDPNGHWTIELKSKQ